MKFSQLFLRKITEIGTTGCQILRLKCIISISAGAPPQTTLGELTALRQTPSWISAGAVSKGGRGDGKGRELRKEGEVEEGKKGREVLGCPTSQSPLKYALVH